MTDTKGHIDESMYLTGMPDVFQDHGICKTLAVRREVIHIKHIFTEVFVRKTIDIQPLLDKIEWNLFDYMHYMTNRLRRVHHFNRQYKKDCNDIVKHDRDRFFPTIDLLSGLDVTIVLDFDGVTTANRFSELYELCCQRGYVQICSANPTITPEWFTKKGKTMPKEIHSMRGMVKKLKRLIEIQRKHGYVFFVDNEKKYLDFAWIFGIQTYHWDGKTINYYTRKTK